VPKPKAVNESESHLFFINVSGFLQNHKPLVCSTCNGQPSRSLPMYRTIIKATSCGWGSRTMAGPRRGVGGEAVQRAGVVITSTGTKERKKKKRKDQKCAKRDGNGGGFSAAHGVTARRSAKSDTGSVISMMISEVSYLLLAAPAGGSQNAIPRCLVATQNSLGDLALPTAAKLEVSQDVSARQPGHPKYPFAAHPRSYLLTTCDMIVVFYSTLCCDPRARNDISGSSLPTDKRKRI